MSPRPRRASYRNCIGTGLGTLLLAAISTTSSSSTSTPLFRLGRKVEDLGKAEFVPVDRAV
jgi:hypothetical protein